MEIGLMLKLYVMTVLADRWAKVLAGLKASKFLMQAKNGIWYAGFPAGVGVEEFADGLAAFIRKICSLVKSATK
jgi:hypothetical protein